MTTFSIQLHNLWNSFVVQSLFFLPRMLIGIVIFLFFLIIALFCRKVLTKVCIKIRCNTAIFSLLARILQSIIIIIGLITALGTVGVNVTALVASLGLFGFAAGFAFKDLLSNTLAGVMILFYRPFVIGDTISGNNFQGKVKEVNLRYVILAGENGPVLVPNSLVLNNVVKILC